MATNTSTTTLRVVRWRAESGTFGQKTSRGSGASVATMPPGVAAWKTWVATAAPVKRLNKTKAQRLGKVYSFDQALSMPVIAPQPLLHAKVDGMPAGGTLLFGERHRAVRPAAHVVPVEPRLRVLQHHVAHASHQLRQRILPGLHVGIAVAKAILGALDEDATARAAYVELAAQRREVGGGEEVGLHGDDRQTAVDAERDSRKRG